MILTSNLRGDVFRSIDSWLVSNLVDRLYCPPFTKIQTYYSFETKMSGYERKFSEHNSHILQTSNLVNIIHTFYERPIQIKSLSWVSMKEEAESILQSRTNYPTTAPDSHDDININRSELPQAPWRKTLIRKLQRRCQKCS